MQAAVTKSALVPARSTRAALAHRSSFAMIIGERGRGGKRGTHEGGPLRGVQAVPDDVPTTRTVESCGPSATR